MAARRPNGSDPIPVRSIRVPDERWDAAKEAAHRSGQTMSAVINDYLDRYPREVHQEEPTP